MTELQELQFLYKEMLHDFIELCKKAKVEYWLDSGTLLGAIRHKGFIPWDDDIDIGMYEKEIRILEKYMKTESSSKYQLLPFDAHEYHHYFSFIKTKKDILSTGREIELFIDIFCYRNYEKTSQFLLWNTLYSPVKYKIEKFRFSFFLRNMMVRLLMEIKHHSTFLQNDRIQEKLLKIYQKSNQMKKDYLGYDILCGFHVELYHKQDFFPLVKKEFESLEVMVPKNYDYFLKRLYGEYKVYPPKKMRRLNHFRDINVEREASI